MSKPSKAQFSDLKSKLAQHKCSAHYFRAHGQTFVAKVHQKAQALEKGLKKLYENQNRSSL